MIAHIGCGYWGKNISNTLFNQGILSAVHDFDAKIHKEYSRKYSLPLLSFNEILANKDILACSVATPAASHYEISKKILLSGKHLFVEKPICLKIEHANELKHIADKKNLKIMVGHLLHYHAGFQELKNILQKKTFGSIKRIKSYRKSFGILRLDEDVIWSFAPHDISMALSIARTHDTSNLAIQRRKYFNKNTDSASISFTCNNIPVEIEVDWCSSEKIQRFEVYCENGIIILDDTLNIEKKLKKLEINFSTKSLQNKNHLDFEPVIYQNSMLPLEAELIAFYKSFTQNNFEIYNDVNEAISVLRVLTEINRL
tara:strand:- start:9698 stop:10639 length:942 start_codon:yes stop_codon:yes gene_type:complete